MRNSNLFEKKFRIFHKTFLKEKVCYNFFMKKCTECKVDKTFDSFSKNSREKDGRNYVCRDCQKARYLRLKDRGPVITVEIKTCSSCKSDLNAKDFGKNAKNLDGLSSVCKGCHNLASPASRWGMKVAEYREFISGGCEACGSFERLCIDHDHDCCPDYSKTCGKCIRGVLCFSCNVAEGHLKGDPERIKSLLRYTLSKKKEV